MKERHTPLNDANEAPPSGSRKGYYMRVKQQLDATFIGTVLGADPAESLIKALKEDQGVEEAAEADRLERKLDPIATGISRNEAEVERVAKSVARRDAEEEDLLKRQEAIEESLKATEIAIVEKSGEILKARSEHALLAIQRRREQREALDELREQRQPEHDQQEPEERRLAREHAAHLSRSLRGSIFTRPVAILLMWIGSVGLLVLGWWTGERIRTVVDTARLAGALDRLADVTTSLLDGGIVWRALVALAVLLLLAVAVPGVRKDLVRRILPARRSRWTNGPLPDDPARAGWKRHVSIVLGVMALPLLTVATMGLLFGGTDVGPMLSTFVGAGAFTFAGMAFCAVIAGATAFCVAAEMDVRDGESSPSRSVPRPFRWVLSVCLAVVVLLEGIRMVRMGAYDLFTLDHAFLPILMTPLVSICLLWGAICLGRHHELRRAQAEVKRLSDELERREVDEPSLPRPDRDRSYWSQPQGMSGSGPMRDAEGSWMSGETGTTAGPRDGVGTRGGRAWDWVKAIFGRDQPPSRTRVSYITWADLDFSPQLVAERESLIVGRKLQTEKRDRVRRELESVKAGRQEARESLERLHEVGAEMRQGRDLVLDENHQGLMGIRRRYRKQLASLDIARSMGIRARTLPDADALRKALTGRESDANGETGI